MKTITAYQLIVQSPQGPKHCGFFATAYGAQSAAAFRNDCASGYTIQTVQVNPEITEIEEF